MKQRRSSVAARGSSMTRARGLLALAIGLLMTISVMGQEATAEPTSEPAPVTPTETPFSTDVPPATPTLLPTLTETTAPELTATPDLTPEPMLEATPPATLPPLPLPATPAAFLETFDGFTGLNWAISGWGAISDEHGGALSATTSGAVASYVAFAAPSLSVNTAFRVSAGSTLAVLVNGYQVLFDAFGSSRISLAEAVLAASEPAAPVEGGTPVINAVVTLHNGQITVATGAVPAISAPLALPVVAAPVTFVATLAEGGSAALHTVAIQELADAPVVIAPLPPVNVPTVTAEPPLPAETLTALPPAEATVEVTPEATLPPDPTATPDITAFLPEVVPFLTSDFEVDLTGWTTTGSIVAENDANRVLLLAANGTLMPAAAVTFQSIEFVARVRPLEPQAALTLSLNGSLVTISAAQAQVLHPSGVMAAPLSPTADGWLTLTIRVEPALLRIAAGDAVVEMPLDPAANSAYGALLLSASGALMLDDIALTDLAPQTTETAPNVSDKLTGSLALLQDALNAGDAALVEQILTDYGFARDDAGRARVEIFATSAEAAAVAGEAVVAMGGSVNLMDGLMVDAFLAPDALLTVALRPDVLMLRQWIGATSTSTGSEPAASPIGPVITEAYNLLGIQDWHAAGVAGAGVRVGVIDTGFVGIADAGETACISSATVVNGVGTGNHGRNVVEILCDLVPAASVFLYSASDYNSLGTAINRARTDGMNVVVITLDLGADETPGDGSGRGGTSDPYTALQAARNAGIVVFAAAGNNGSPANIGNPDRAARYVAVTATGTSFTVNANLTTGDRVNVNTSAGSFSVSGAVSIIDAPGAQGGSGTFVSASCVSPTTCAQSFTIDGLMVGATVQVQIVPVPGTGEASQTAAVRITGVTGGTLVSNAGSLARPADSPHVITVGAVCTDDSVGKNFVALPDASVGPIYGPGGIPSTLGAMPATGFLRGVVKPDFVAPSFVTTSLLAGGTPESCDGTITGADSASLFEGSSAAAAHAAGMAALLLSNSAAPGYERFSQAFNAPEDVVENLRFHMQSRSADLPAATPNGYDMQTGAGVATMGHPHFNLTHSVNPTLPPTDFTCPNGGSILYVGQGDRTSGGNGTLLNPFASIGLALRQAAANACVVVLPGEYTTPIVASGIASGVTLISYDGASALDELDTVIRITGQQYHPTEPTYNVVGFALRKSFERVAGFTVFNQANPLTVEGFTFLAPQIRSLNDGLREPQAVLIDSSAGTRIIGSSVGAAVVNGTAYPGWGNLQTLAGLEATPMQVILSTNISLERNVFDGNVTDGNGFDITGALAIVDSSATVRSNEFLNNQNRTDDAGDIGAIVLIEQSDAALVANAFAGNWANSIVQIRTAAQEDTETTRIVSNVFLGNTGFRGGDFDRADGLFNLYFAARTFVVNNTFVRNSFGSALALRGVNDTTIAGVPSNAASQTFDFHNNLAFENNFGAGSAGNLLVYANPVLGSGCTSNAPIGSSYTFNWDVNNTIRPGSCGAASNRTDNITLSEDFIGDQAGFAQTDWRFWGLASNPNTRANAVDNGGNIGQFGIPMLDANNYAAPFNVDALGRQRTNKAVLIPLAPTNTDIGAFEFTRLVIDDNGCDITSTGNGIPAAFGAAAAVEDQGIIDITLACGDTSFVVGALGNLTVTIPTSGEFDGDGEDGPAPRLPFTNISNFSARCANEFEGTRGVIAESLPNGIIILRYCPPEHFYTVASQPVQIYYTVTDELGNTVTGRVDVPINPVDDLPLTASLGDENPLGDVFEIAMLTNSEVNVRLRPFVTFGNFEWSEADNPEFNPPDGAMADYPFELVGTPSIVEGSGIIGSLTVISPNELRITATASRGIARITYVMEDANGNRATHTLRVRVASVIPAEPGIYDDSSIYWQFENGQLPANSGRFRWQAVSNARAINNTLHTSSGGGDEARFSMIGTGFVLYMQGTSGGANYTISVNGRPTSVWAYVEGTIATSNPAISRATIDLLPDGPSASDLECFARTRHVATTASPPVSTIFLSNNQTLPYTVMCNSQTRQRLNVAIVNGSPNGPTLSIDAFGLLDDTTTAVGGPFTPGRYDFDNGELRGIIPDINTTTPNAPWDEVRLAALSGGIGARALAGAADITFNLTGATGFAIGTALHPAGAEFTLCVSDERTPVPNDLCQRVDTSPLGTTTPLAYNAFVPWYGLDPAITYTVTIRGITRPPLPAALPVIGTLLFDSLTVFGTQDAPAGTLANGTTENDQLAQFAYLGGREDSWTQVFNNATASNRTLSTTTVTHAGPALVFNIAADATSFLYDFASSATLSRQLKVCVDRDVLTPTANDYGRCIVIDLRTSTYRQVLADGTLSLTPGTQPLRLARNTLSITEAMFDGGWPASGDHQVEIFSLVNEAFNFDRVTVYGAGVLSPGVHEEFIGAFTFYDASSNVVTPGVFNPRSTTLNYTAPTTPANTFLLTNDASAARDSGGSIMWTKQVGASIVFGVDGDGFYPRFRFDNNSDAVSVCWLRTSGALPLPQFIRDTGECVVYDNFSTALLNNQSRAILGLDDTTGSADYYAVAITHLGDNFLPPARRTSPHINLWFDGVTVVRSGWQALTPLTAGTPVETSFANRTGQNRFFYSPTAWAAASGPAATFSGGLHDISRSPIGASVTFRTTGADGIAFRRTPTTGQALLEVCAAPESDLNARHCSVISNSAPVAGNTVVALLNTSGDTSPHVVTISALTGGSFILDTITPVDNSAPLAAGLYDDNAPGIRYIAGRGSNLVLNGALEAFVTGSGAAAWSPVGGATIASGVPAYDGSAAGVVVTGDGQGIESSPIRFEAGQRYVVIARAMIDGTAGSVSMALLDGVTPVTGFTPQTINFLATRPYQVLYTVFQPGSTVTARLRFTATGLQPLTPTNLASRRFLLDSVSVFATGDGSWEILSNTAAQGRTVTRSIEPGGEVRFAFAGTGFRVGMVTDRLAGAVEICYGTDSNFTGATCIIHENESAVASTRVSRTFAGLPLNTYYVRIRDAEDGRTSLLAGTPTRIRTEANGRIALDFVEVFDAPPPPALTASGIFNENHRVGGVQALQLLPTSGWRVNSAPNLTAFSGSSNFTVADTATGLAAANIAGHVAVLRLDLSAGATLILRSDAPVGTRPDLLYCVDGFDGTITLNPATRRYEITGSTRCAVTSQLASSPQASLRLRTATSSSTVTITALGPAPLLIDGYEVLIGTALTPGYYETSLSEGAGCAGNPTLDTGCVASSGSFFNANTPANWTRQTSTAFSGGTALVLEAANSTIGSTAPAATPITGTASRLVFNIEDATGFSLITTLNTLGGTFTVTAAGAQTYTFTGSTTFSASVQNRVPIPFTGLPQGNYTITIENTGARNLIIDAVDVYGEIQTLGSLYDDAVTDIDGTLLITYGPRVGVWTAVRGTTARGSLNETFHSATTSGAVAMFNVEDATGITVLTAPGASANNVRVCYRNTSALANQPACTTPQNIGSTTAAGGRAVFAFPTAGDYTVSIVSGGALRLDAVQVNEAGALAEGIYPVEALRTNNGTGVSAFGGTWTFSPATTATRTASASTFTFRMRGIGFSILLNEATTSASPYTLCITRDSACDTLNQTITRIAAPTATQPFALTIVGLHGAGGSDQEYTVTLSSTDTRPLTVSGLHILGSRDPDFRLTADNARVENDDPRLRLLPFGWAVNVTDTTGNTSGGSQASGTRRGGIAYFEFEDSATAIEYVRQISTVFSNVDICVGPISTDKASLWANHTTACTTVNNKEANAFGRATVVTTTQACADGCWVMIRNTEDRVATFDFARLVPAGGPLQPGQYEENFSGLRNFRANLDGAGNVIDYTLGTAGDLLGMNINPQVTVSGASGTFVRRYAAAATTTPPTTSALSGGLFFSMEGTGFSIGFVTDNAQGDVRICHLRYSGQEPSVSEVLGNGMCQTFSNQSATPAFRVNRSILGLPQATYVVAVQFLGTGGPAATTLRMDIDSVTVHGDIWFDSAATNWLSTAHTTPITPALGRVETSFQNRAAVNTVQYYGTWSSAAGAPYSGGGYDLTTRAGSGVVFRTAGANAITLFTALGAPYTEIFLCATPLNLAPLTATSPTVCEQRSLTGSGFQQPVTFVLGDAVDEYVVSITTRRNAPFHLDAIQAFDRTLALTPGLYEGDDARIRYDARYTNRVPNGDFEQVAPNRAPLEWSPIGTPTVTTVTSTVINGTRYASFTTTATNTGLRSRTFQVPTTGTYPVAAHVLLSRGTAQLRLIENGITIRTIPFTTPGASWQPWREFIQLTAGSDYEFVIVSTSAVSTIGIDGVQVNEGGLWRSESGSAFSAGRAQRSLTAGASVTFNFTGTGFALNMIADRSGGETEVCYGVGSPTNCFIYQNELATVSSRVSRVVAGLPQNTYVVRVREVDDGFSTLVANNVRGLRPNSNAFARLSIDSVEIFGAVTLPPITPGTYGNAAVSGAGQPLFVGLPASRWRTITGSGAAAFSDASVLTVAEANGSPSATFAGPSLNFSIQKQAGRSATLVFSLGPANTARSTQVLICAGNVVSGQVTWDGRAFGLANAGQPGACTLRTTARTDREFVVNASDLTALGTASSGTIRISMVALTPGRLDFDGLTYLTGDALTTGVNDEFFAPALTTNPLAQNAALLRFAVGNNFGINRETRPFSASLPTGCNANQHWCITRATTYFGGAAAFTRANNATLTFNFEGSGFGLIMQTEATAGDVRICYKRAINQTEFPPLAGPVTPPGSVRLLTNDATGIYCETRRLNSSAAGATPWQALNDPRINPNPATRYTFSFYGLPQGRYTVEVRTILPGSTTSRVVVDAVTVFRNPAALPALGTGLHDDIAPSFSYEPGFAWSRVTTPSTPPAGAFGLGEHITRLAGSIAQVRVTGNSVTFFQSNTSASSRDVSLCMLVTAAGTAPGNVHCGETSQQVTAPSVQLARWSQSGTGRMSPVMIYGLGEGTHTLILENRDHNRPMSIDAIAVQP